MKKGATTIAFLPNAASRIIALRNEKGSYNSLHILQNPYTIIALRNEKGSYNQNLHSLQVFEIIALRNEKGSYNLSKYE